MSPKKIMKVLSILLSGEEVGIQTWNLQNPFEVLIGTVLSQRTRDENTSKAVKSLFSRYRSAKEISSAPVEDIEKLIRVSGFYKVKARRIKEISRIIIEKYNGSVPCDMDELVSIPGVGRKTAGCVLVYGFGCPAIPVDTHVHRISNRLGFVKTRTPEQTEQELMARIPKEMWISLNNAMVGFGQKTCKPIGPHCWDCPLSKLCEFPEKGRG